MEENKLPVIKLDPKDSPLARLIQEQREQDKTIWRGKKGPDIQVAPIHDWINDELRPYRWYHLRWDWLRLWWIQWRRGDQPFTGILCPLLGRHWYKDWKGRIDLYEAWSKKRFERFYVCCHCGQRRVTYSISNPFDFVPLAHTFKEVK